MFCLRAALGARFLFQRLESQLLWYGVTYGVSVVLHSIASEHYLNEEESTKKAQ